MQRAVGCAISLAIFFTLVVCNDCAATEPSPQTSAITVDKPSIEEHDPTKPLPDESGAKWKLRVAPTSRKSNLLGRSSMFSVQVQRLLIPIDKSLTMRSWETGKANSRNSIALDGRLLELSTDRSATSVVLIKRGENPSPSDSDIIYLDGNVVWKFAAINDPKWPRKNIPLLESSAWHGTAEVRLIGHSQPPWRLVLSPNGNRLASCSDDGTIRLWDLEATAHGANRRAAVLPFPDPNYGKEIASFPCYSPDDKGNVTRGEFVAFSPYGHWLVTAFNHRVHFRSPEDGAEEFNWEPNVPDSQRIMALRFESDGSTLLAFLENADETKTSQLKFLQYDLDQHEERRFEGMHGVVDGRTTTVGDYIVTWDGSPEVVFWEVAQHKEVASLQVAPNHVYDVAFTPNGDVFATAGDDGEVKFWKVKSWDQQEPIRLETKVAYKHEGVDVIKFSDDGKRMITSSDDGWLKAWDAPDFCRPRESDALATNPTIKKDADGTMHFLLADGRVEERHPDGTVKVTYPDGREKIIKRQ